VILSVFVRQHVVFFTAHGRDTYGILSRMRGQFASHIAMRYHLVRTLRHADYLLIMRLLTECIDGYFGDDCSHQCRCANDDVCAKDGGGCPSRCAAGWNGTDCQDGIVALRVLVTISFSNEVVCLQHITCGNSH